MERTKGLYAGVGMACVTLLSGMVCTLCLYAKKLLPAL